MKDMVEASAVQEALKKIPNSSFAAISNAEDLDIPNEDKNHIILFNGHYIAIKFKNDTITVFDSIGDDIDTIIQQLERFGKKILVQRPYKNNTTKGKHKTEFIRKQMSNHCAGECLYFLDSDIYNKINSMGQETKNHEEQIYWIALLESKDNEVANVLKVILDESMQVLNTQLLNIKRYSDLAAKHLQTINAPEITDQEAQKTNKEIIAIRDLLNDFSGLDLYSAISKYENQNNEQLKEYIKLIANNNKEESKIMKQLIDKDDFSNLAKEARSLAIKKELKNSLYTYNFTGYTYEVGILSRKKHDFKPKNSEEQKIEIISKKGKKTSDIEFIRHTFDMAIASGLTKVTFNDDRLEKKAKRIAKEGQYLDKIIINPKIQKNTSDALKPQLAIEYKPQITEKTEISNNPPNTPYGPL